MSVNATETDPAERDRILKFLREKGASFPNFILKDTDANEERYGKDYPTVPTPLMMLFDRQGNRARVMIAPDDDEVETEVKALLAAK